MRCSGPLVALAIGISAIWVAAIVAGVPIPAGAFDLASGSLALYVVYWVVADARQRRRVPCHDFGFFVALLLPVSLAWYVVWTRGWRGLTTLAGLFALFCLPWLSAILAVTWIYWPF